MYRQYIWNWLAEAGPNKETIATPFICLQYFFYQISKESKAANSNKNLKILK